MQKEYDILKVIDWKECKELIENVRENQKKMAVFYIKLAILCKML